MKLAHKKEFGDFQTPPDLSRQICTFLATQHVSPASIIEPTCGTGSFIHAAIDIFPQTETIFGIEINEGHLQSLQQSLAQKQHSPKVELLHADFFKLDWESLLEQFPEPILILGNPPWVTNAALGALRGNNLPVKSNFQNHTGLDAITGKSNFDISEWMVTHLIQWSSGRDSVLAMLLKTSVARKLLKHLWGNHIKTGQVAFYRLDGKQTFGVSVDMGLFVCHLTPNSDGNQTCQVHNGLTVDAPVATIGFKKDTLIANIPLYEQWQHLYTHKPAPPYRWRSGIKHDVSRILELTGSNGKYENGLGESLEIEDTFIYPLLKSSDIASGTTGKPRRWILLPQTHIGENTAYIKHTAPKTWAYLTQHQSFFNRRKSSIYKNKPRFSIFGVGDYTFAPWKVVISGLYKTLHFVVVAPYQNKPILLDDTCYFLACHSKNEADFLTSLLNSNVAQAFFSAFIFWDAKRPVTAGILGKLNLSLLAQELDKNDEFQKYTRQKIIQPSLLPLSL